MGDTPTVDIGLVLSGGGSKGAFEVGVLAAVEEAGLVPTVVAGTSAGAINAAAVAIGMPSAELGAIWRTIRTEDVFRVRRDVRQLVDPRRLVGPAGNFAERLLESVAWTWLLDTTPLRQLILRITGTEVLAVRSDIVLTVTAVDAQTGGSVRFASTPLPGDRRDDRVVVVDFNIDHLLASSAMPLLFRPVELDGRMFWDGGLVANTPLSACLAYEPDAILVVTTSPLSERPRPTTLGEAISLLVDDVLHASLLRELWHAETVNELVRVSPEHRPDKVVDLVLIEPTVEVGSTRGILDFDPARTARLIDAGYETARRVITAWEPTA